MFNFFLGKTFAIFACIVVTMAGVAVIGSIIIKIMKITQHGVSIITISSCFNLIQIIIIAQLNITGRVKGNLNKIKIEFFKKKSWTTIVHLRQILTYAEVSRLSYGVVVS